MIKTSELVLCKLIQYLRYKKQIHSFSIEHPMSYGGFFADLVAFKEREMWEFEIKISWSDFINDFKKKRIKHERYDEKIILGSVVVPNKFWFVVPADEKLYTRVKDYLKENYPKYGLLCVDLNGRGAGRYDFHTTSIRTAKRINGEVHQDHGCDNTAYLSRRLLNFYYKVRQNEECKEKQ